MATAKKSRPNRRTIVDLAKRLVTVEKAKAVTTSLTVAEAFGKGHREVLRQIRNLTGETKSHCAKLHRENEPSEMGGDKETAAFMRAHFLPATYKSDRGRTEPMFYMTEEGFMLVVMGFTGDEALKWKIRFINAFQWMRAKLETYRARKDDPQYSLFREEGKKVRRAMTDTAKKLILYCEAQGCEPRKAAWIYGNLTRTAYSKLFKPSKSQGIPMRETLSVSQIRTLTLAEELIDRELACGMLDGIEYHDLYELVKARLDRLAMAIGGRTEPGSLTAREVAELAGSTI